MSWECFKNNYQTSALHDHMLFHKAVVCPEDFSILAKSSCSFKLEIQEGILIKLLFDIIVDYGNIHYLENRSSNLINV